MAICSRLLSQSISPYTGAEVDALARITSISVTSHPVFNNPAKIPNQNTEASAGYVWRYGLKELSTNYISGVYTLSNMHIGLGIRQFGSELYSEQSIALGTGKEIGVIAIGGTVTTDQISDELGRRETHISTNLGVTAQISPKIYLGTVIYNIGLSTMEDRIQQRSIAKSGLKYVPFDSFSLLIELEKGIDTPVHWATGATYTIENKLIFRAGFRPDPYLGSVGFGIKWKGYVFDYALGETSLLGISHSINLTKAFGK